MKKVKDVLGMVCVLEILAHVMQISMDKIVNMPYVPIIVVNMGCATWKLTVVSVMKDGLVIDYSI